MCESSLDSSCLSPLEKHINDKKLAIDLLKISDNSYVGFREHELNQLNSFLTKCIESKRGGGMFIFGLCGTGKTTTVQHALNVTSSKKGVKTVFLKGSNYTSMKSFKNDFYQKVFGFSAKKALKTLNLASQGKVQDYAKFSDHLLQHFQSQRSLKICLIDEVDYLSTFISNFKSYNKSNWLIQALFKASCSPKSKVVVLAVSNNLEFASKIKTENCERMLFKPYNEDQMVNIVMEKLKSVNENSQVLNKTSLLLIARRVANTSGDCRTYLDSFIRALSNSLSDIEKDYESVESLASAVTSVGPDSFSRSEQTYQVESYEEFKTPTRNFSPLGESTNNFVDMSKYNVGSKEIGVVTPTLSLNKTQQLKNQLSDLPIFQLLLLLGICKSTIILNQTISKTDSKVYYTVITSILILKYFLELAEKLKLDPVDAENFCNSEFENSLENFKQLNFISIKGTRAN
ncbi:CDC6-like ATPase, putative [Theileria annulata]|uniref:CDC6-like ATPase, putative n=1 Tax=Theileria annulata TaxID=5874 RepID=Q4UF40_THEAN|nr:CDC6-like ATPase, putative [Theileria annulata]CAI74299.1 CDC6-like ATPase, putative [Theileria annulata]|eukprot:XP_952031.1 CDC6-like ATPase, putative [Theileria annulata]